MIPCHVACRAGRARARVAAALLAAAPLLGAAAPDLPVEHRIHHEPLPAFLQQAAVAASPDSAIRVLPGLLAGGEQPQDDNNWVSMSVMDMQLRRLIGGQFAFVSNGTSYRNYARMLLDGNIDPDYSGGAEVTGGPVYAIWRMADSTETHVGGNFTQVEALAEHARLFRANDTPYPTINRYVDPLYQPQPNNMVRFIADERISGRNTFLAGGSFTTADGVAFRGVGRLDNGGNVAQNHNLSASEVRTLMRYPDGRVLVGGTFTVGSTNQNMLRYTADGLVDATFPFKATGNGNHVNTITMQPDGKLLVGGSFDFVNGTAHKNLVRLNADGTRDAGFNPNINGEVYSLVLFEDGSMAVGGIFSSAGGATANRFALLSPTGALLQTVSFNHDVHGINADALGNLHISGKFTSPTNLLAVATLPPGTETPSLTYTRATDSYNVSLARSGTLPLPERARFVWFDTAGTQLGGVFAQRNASGVWSATVPAVQQSGTFHLVPEYHLRGGLNNASMAVTRTAWAIELKRYRVTYNVPGGGLGSGTVSADAGPYVIAGDSVMFTITPDNSSYLDTVSGCGGTLNGNLYVTAPASADCVVTVTFAPRKLTADIAGNAGFINPSLVVPAQNQTPISVSYQLDPHREFDHIEKSGTPDADACAFDNVSGSSFTGMLANATSCHFRVHWHWDSHSVTPISSGAGTISPFTPVSVTHGQTTQFTLSPAQGWGLAQVSGCNGTLSGSTYTTGAIDEDCVVYAEFVLMELPLTSSVQTLAPYVAYGKPFEFLVSLTNDGTSTAHDISLQSNAPAAADPTSLVWACLDEASPGFACGSGQGAIADGGVSIPAGGTAHWLLHGVVPADSDLPTLDFTTTVGAPWLATPIVRGASVPLVLYVDGFEVDEDADAGDAEATCANEAPCDTGAPHAPVD